MIEKHFTKEDLTKLFSELFSNSDDCNVVRSFIINNQSILKKEVKNTIGNITSGSTVLHILASTIDTISSSYYYWKISDRRSLNNDMDNIIKCLYKMIIEAPDDEIIRITTNLNIINVTNENGKTALDIANQNGKQDLIEIIDKLSQNSRSKSKIKMDMMSRSKSRTRSKVNMASRSKNMQTISNNSLISPMEIVKIEISKDLIIADYDENDKHVIKIKRNRGTRGYVVKKVTKKRKNNISKSKKTSTLKR